MNIIYNKIFFNFIYFENFIINYLKFNYKFTILCLLDWNLILNKLADFCTR